MEAGEFSTVRDLAIAVNLAERHVSRQLRLAYLAPEVLNRLTCGREASAATLKQLVESALLTWQEQEVRAFGEGQSVPCPASSEVAYKASPSGSVRCANGTE